VADQPRIHFSIQIPFAESAKEWTEKVRRADDLGFYSVSVPDHLGPSLPQLAPLVALSHAAAATSQLRLAITVLDNDFRHPVMLAKEIATLDLLSEGRVDMGMGAGWLEEDYVKTGVARWDAPSVRVDRLIESVSLLRELFRGRPVTFEGQHYHVQDFESFPTPIQSPVPLMVGARGKRMLSFAAKEAQIVSILAATSEGGNRLAGFEQQLRWIEEAGGRERKDLMVGIRVPGGQVAGPAESGPAVAVEYARRLGMPLPELLASPFVVVGDLKMIRDHLIEVAATYGTTYMTFSEAQAWDLGPIVAELGA